MLQKFDSTYKHSLLVEIVGSHVQTKQNCIN